jgi:hypothetical protein
MEMGWSNLHYEVTMQLFEAFKHNPVIVTLIVLMIAASLGVLLKLTDKKRYR